MCEWRVQSVASRDNDTCSPECIWRLKQLHVLMHCISICKSPIQAVMLDWDCKGCYQLSDSQHGWRFALFCERGAVKIVVCGRRV